MNRSSIGGNLLGDVERNVVTRADDRRDQRLRPELPEHPFPEVPTRSASSQRGPSRAGTRVSSDWRRIGSGRSTAPSSIATPAAIARSSIAAFSATAPPTLWPLLVRLGDALGLGRPRRQDPNGRSNDPGDRDGDPEGDR